MNPPPPPPMVPNRPSYIQTAISHLQHIKLGAPSEAPPPISPPPLPPPLHPRHSLYPRPPCDNMIFANPSSSLSDHRHGLRRSRPLSMHQTIPIHVISHQSLFKVMEQRLLLMGMRDSRIPFPIEWYMVNVTIHLSTTVKKDTTINRRIKKLSIVVALRW